jgi:hypothetical protein
MSSWLREEAFHLSKSTSTLREEAFHLSKSTEKHQHENTQCSIQDGLIVGEGTAKVPGLCIRNRASDKWSALRLYDPFSDSMLHPCFNPRAGSGWHYNYMCRNDIEQPSEKELMEMELEGLKSDALISLVDGVNVAVICPDGDPAAHSSSGGAAAGQPDHNTGFPPLAEQEEEFVHDGDDADGYHDHCGPSKEEEAVADAMGSFGYDCDQLGDMAMQSPVHRPIQLDELSIEVDWMEPGRPLGMFPADGELLADD